MARSTILLGGIVLALGFCPVAAAATPHLMYPRPCCPSNCPPGVGTYGYFPTTWRSWPCEERPEITNPRSVGAERLATPQGQEQLPLPQPQPTPLPQQPSAPRGGMPTPGAAVPEPQARAPVTPPAAPKTEKPATPLPEGGLPGLPVEPDQSQVPGLPKAGATPPLDLNPPSQPGKETTKPSSDVPSQEKPQAKEGVKPAEQPKPQTPPKPSSTEKSLPGAGSESTQRNPTAAASFDERDLPPDTAIRPSGSRLAEGGREASVRTAQKRSS